MKRRDTIIIAVLVNAGILLVLFATALRSGDKKKEAPSQLEEFNLPSKSGEAPLSTEDLLNEYIASTTLPQGQEIPEIVDLANPSAVTPIVAAPQPNVTMPTLGQPLVHDTTLSSTIPAQSAVPVVAAPVVPPAPVVAQEEVVEVTVKKGDYLEKIAKSNSSSVNAIMKANNLASTQLKIGQVLKVPVVKGKEASKEVAASGVSGQDDFYVIKEGDSPWAIANKCHVKLDDLLKMNNIDDQKAKRLRPGDKLRIR